MGALLTILLTLGPHVAIQISLGPTAEQERAAYIEQLDTEVAQLSKVKPDSVEQIVKFAIEQNMIAPRTELPLKSESTVHVIDSGLPGYVRVALLGPQDAPEVRGRNFTYIQHDLTDPHALVITTISSISGQIVLARDGENDRYHWSVQVVQDAPPAPGAFPDQDPIRFLVHRESTDNDKEIDLKLSGAKLHAASDATRGGAGCIPATDPARLQTGSGVVRRASASGVAGAGTGSTTDPAVQEKLTKTIAQLDADNFRDRQDAAAQLRQLGQPAALALAKLDRSNLSLQQASAIDEFLAEFAPVAADQLSNLADDKSFLLDVLFNDDAALRGLALKRLAALTGKQIELKSESALDRAQEVAKLRGELVPTNTTLVVRSITLKGSQLGLRLGRILPQHVLCRVPAAE
jgi:hypothetical protein